MKPRLVLINGEWFCIGSAAVARGATMQEAHLRWYAMRVFA